MDNTLVEIKDKKGEALASFILGLTSIIAWIIPIFGAPITITGFVLGLLGRKSSRKRLAIAGIALCIIFFIVTSVNSISGVILYLHKFQ